MSKVIGEAFKAFIQMAILSCLVVGRKEERGGKGRRAYSNETVLFLFFLFLGGKVTQLLLEKGWSAHLTTSIAHSH